MNKTLVKGGAVALAALPLGICLAGAQVTQSGQGYLFRAKFSKGETIRYSVVSTVAVPDQPKSYAFDMPIMQKVNGVAKGIADLTVTVGPMQVNGQSMSKAQTTRVKVNPQLKLVGASPTPGSENATFTTLPANPVKVGGTWSSSQALGTFGGGPGGKVDMTYKLVGVKKVAGRQVAALLVSFSNPGAQKISGTGTAHIDVSSGLLRDMVLNISAAGSMTGQPNGAPMRFSVKVDRK